jgi:hypothetical protein
MAYVHRKLGPKAVLEALRLGRGDFDREFLEAQANQLFNMGLGQVAETVMQASGRAKPLLAFCPYDPVEDHANYITWIRSNHDSLRYGLDGHPIDKAALYTAAPKRKAYLR